VDTQTSTVQTMVEMDSIASFHYGNWRALQEFRVLSIPREA